MTGNTDSEKELIEQKYLVVGKISTPHGIKGWVKVFSFTDPIENILQYQPWFIRHKQGWLKVRIGDGRIHGKTVIAHIIDVDDRDSAEELKGLEIAVLREQLPETDTNEFYWIDLIGLEVINEQGFVLGTVDHLMETGANDVLVIKGDKEHLVPYVPGEFIKKVDLQNKQMVVDWDADF